MNNPSLPIHASWTPSERRLLAAIAVLSVVLGWLGRQPLITTGGDDATYILLARSMASGHFRDIFLPGAPAHAQYPPGFPLMILAVRTIAGGMLEAVRIANLGLLVLIGLLTGVSVRRFAGARIGLLTAALVMLNPLLLHYAGWILSETLFVACTMVALWSSQPQRGWMHGKWWLVAVIAALAAFFTRSVGITVVFAMVGGLIIDRRWRLASLLGVAAIGLTSAWFVYTRWAASRTLGWSYANDLAYVQPNRIIELAGRMASSARYYLLAFPGRALGIPDVPDMPLDNLLWIILIVGPVLVGLYALRRTWPTALLYTVLMVGVLLVFPFTVARLLVPLIPMVLVALLLGSGALARRVGAARPERAVTAVALLLVAVFVARDAQAAISGRACRAQNGDGCRSTAERDWVDTAEWLRSRLPASAVVASSKPSTLYLLSHRAGIPSRILSSASLDEVLAPRGPVTHILLSGLWGYERGSLARRLAEVCNRLRPIPVPNESTLLLEVLPTATDDAAGCTKLHAFEGPLELD